MSNERSPLWQVLMNAGDPPCTIQEMLAAEILAVRDWLFPEEEEPALPERHDPVAWKLWKERQNFRNLLTSEAERAENPNT